MEPRDQVVHGAQVFHKLDGMGIEAEDEEYGK